MFGTAKREGREDQTRQDASSTAEASRRRALPLRSSVRRGSYARRFMLDVFTRKTTCIQGRALPGAGERAAIQDDHERRLASLARLGAAAEKCDLRADSDQDLVLLAEDEVSLLEGAGGEWAELGDAIVTFLTA